MKEAVGKWLRALATWLCGPIPPRPPRPVCVLYFVPYESYRTMALQTLGVADSKRVLVVIVSTNSLYLPRIMGMRPDVVLGLDNVPQQDRAAVCAYLRYVAPARRV